MLFSNGSSRRSSDPFTARWGGECARCPAGIEQGEEVMYDGDELVHVECTSLPVRPEKKPCARCFLVHAGECF